MSSEKLDKLCYDVTPCVSELFAVALACKKKGASRFTHADKNGYIEIVVTDGKITEICISDASK